MCMQASPQKHQVGVFFPCMPRREAMHCPTHSELLLIACLLALSLQSIPRFHVATFDAFHARAATLQHSYLTYGAACAASVHPAMISRNLSSGRVVKVALAGSNGDRSW